MTTTQTTPTQAELDAQAYQALQDADGNATKAAAALGMARSTFQNRIKRHAVRAEQDTLADSRALDAAQAEQDAEYAADSEAAEAVFARIEASNPDMRAMAEIDAALGSASYQVIAAETDDGPVEIARFAHIDISDPATDDSDESATAPLEDGAPELPGADVLEQLIKARGAEYNDGTVPAPAQTRKAAGCASKPALAVLPEGVITPGQFRDMLVAEDLAGEELQSKTVCDWVKRAKGFPAKFYGPDGAVYDEQQKAGGKVITVTGVFAGPARQWFIDRAAKTAKAA